MIPMRYCTMTSPLGPLLLLGNGEALSGLYMLGQKNRPEPAADWKEDTGALASAREQLKSYFAGELRTFNLALAPAGTEFQQRVWRALLDIPFGRTESYGALAQRIGRAGAARAVGLANGRNRIGIVVPCHRVVGSDGALTGYAGGLDRKRWLLQHESRVVAMNPGAREQERGAQLV